MSCTSAEEGQESSVGTTRPTPLPLRVGAKHSTCSGPACRRGCLPRRPGEIPADSSNPPLRTSGSAAQPADPTGGTTAAPPAQPTDPATAPTTAETHPP